MRLASEPLGVSPDGDAQWLVRVRFVARDGSPTQLLSGGDIDFRAPGATTQWQTRARFGGPAAIVSTTHEGTLRVDVRAIDPRGIAPAQITIDTRPWRGRRVVARALGPHLVRIGWFPAVRNRVVRIWRRDPHETLAVTVQPHAESAPLSSVTDELVRPGMQARYEIDLPGQPHTFVAAGVPAEARHGALPDLRGKKLWLAFSPDSRDPDGYDSLDPQSVVERAVATGVRGIELRTSYGPFDETAGAPRRTIDALLDGAAARGVAVIAWTVPRTATFADLARSTAPALYRTPAGNGYAAIALDLERGERYLGSGPAGYAAIVAYARAIRAALGPHYPIVATVEDAYFERLPPDAYPFREVAEVADVLQPMAYWRMMSPRASTPRTVRASLRASYATMRALAGRDVPIDIGGQTSGEGPRGAPPAAEIAAAISEARSLGAFGITFFDWRGTNDRQWNAIARTRW